MSETGPFDVYPVSVGEVAAEVCASSLAPLARGRRGGLAWCGWAKHGGGSASGGEGKDGARGRWLGWRKQRFFLI